MVAGPQTAARFKHLLARRGLLEEYGINITEIARRGDIDPVIGRDEEIIRVIEILNRRTKNNPVLIGEPGVGKLLVEGLAQKIVDGDVPHKLQGKQVIRLMRCGQSSSRNRYPRPI